MTAAHTQALTIEDVRGAIKAAYDAATASLFSGNNDPDAVASAALAHLTAALAFRLQEQEGQPTLSDELESTKRMFVAACADLGLINEALGLDPDDGGAAPILAAIKRKDEAIMAAVTTKPRARLLTQVELDSIGAQAEGMDGQQWDIWVQEKFSEVNGIHLIGSFR